MIVVIYVLALGYFSSNGSGFLIASNGLVVTNAHVIARCNRYSKIQVCLAQQQGPISALSLSLNL